MRRNYACSVCRVPHQRLVVVADNGPEALPGLHRGKDALIGQLGREYRAGLEIGFHLHTLASFSVVVFHFNKPYAGPTLALVLGIPSHLCESIRIKAPEVMGKLWDLSGMTLGRDEDKKCRQIS